MSDCTRCNHKCHAQVPGMTIGGTKAFFKICDGRIPVIAAEDMMLFTDEMPFCFVKIDAKQINAYRCNCNSCMCWNCVGLG